MANGINIYEKLHDVCHIAFKIYIQFHSELSLIETVVIANLYEVLTPMVFLELEL